MSATATATKKKLTIAQATEQWADAKAAIAILEAELEEAAEVLLTHHEKTDRRTFGDLVAVIYSTPRLILDQAKVRAHLGKDLPDFQTRTTSKPGLSLLR